MNKEVVQSSMPFGIDIYPVNKYLDLAKVGYDLAEDYYLK